MEVVAPRAAGKYTQIVAPWPGVLSTPIVPPWASMIDLQMLKPSPLPWADSRAPRFVATIKALENVRQVVRSMPRPVSETRSTTCCRAAVGVNFDPHAAPARREFQAVIDQVIDDLPQSIGIALTAVSRRQLALS